MNLLLELCFNHNFFINTIKNKGADDKAFILLKLAFDTEISSFPLKFRLSFLQKCIGTFFKILCIAQHSKKVSLNLVSLGIV